MGIKDLLPNLKSITNRVALKDLCALSVAVDGNSCLYKASYCCPRDIALNEEPTPAFYAYIKKFIKVLYQQNIESVVLVFDGCESAAKRNENRRRHEQRMYFLEEAKKADRQGDGQTAYKYYKRAVYISMKVVQKVLIKLAEWNVPFMIAPYEADAQLAFFGKFGFADIIITEDSDLLAYGCPKIFYKMDVNTGAGDFICYANLRYNQELSFANWDETQFMLFCCLMCCDYHPRVPKLGVKGIHAFITRLGASAPKIDLDTALRRIFAAQSVIDVNTMVVSLKQSLLTFKYHIIYNPMTKSTEHLSAIPPELLADQAEEIRCVIGEHIPGELVRDFIYGKIEPKEMQTYLLDCRDDRIQPRPAVALDAATYQPHYQSGLASKTTAHEDPHADGFGDNNKDDPFGWHFVDDDAHHAQDETNSLLRKHESRLQQQALELNQTATYHLREAQHISDYQHASEDRLSMNNPMPAKAFVSPSVTRKFQSMRRRRIMGDAGSQPHGHHRRQHRSVREKEQHRAAEIEFIDSIGVPSLTTRDYGHQGSAEEPLRVQGLYREPPSKKRVVEQIYPEYKYQADAAPDLGSPVWR